MSLNAVTRYSFLFATLFGCGQPQSGEGPLVFLYNEAAGVASLDPMDAISLAHIRIQAAVYETLTDASGNGVLADSVVSNDMGLSWLIYLKPNVPFHAHAALPQNYILSATDVVASLSRIRESSRLGWLLDGVTAITELDVDLVRLELAGPDMEIPRKLSSPFSAILPKPLVANADLRFSASGTGPYFLHKWIPGERLILHRFTAYRAFGPETEAVLRPDALAVSFLKDGQTMLLEFLSGRLDGLPGLNPAYSNHLLGGDGELVPKWEEEFQFCRYPFLNTEYIGFNLKGAAHPVLQYAEIRQAMAASVRVAELLNGLRSGIGRPAEFGMVPPEIALHEQAKDPFAGSLTQWLAKEGIPPVEQWPPIHIHTDGNHSDLVASVVANWQALGIPVRIQLEDRAGLKAGIARGRFSIFKASWIADYPDARNYYQLFLQKNVIPKGANYTSYVSGGFESAYERGDWVALDSFLVADMPVIPLYYDESVWFLQKKWTPLEVDPLGRPNFSRLYLRR